MFKFCPLLFQTVRLWQASENGKYDCRHILKDHAAEVNFICYDLLVSYQVTNGCFYNSFAGG